MFALSVSQPSSIFILSNYIYRSIMTKQNTVSRMTCGYNLIGWVHGLFGNDNHVRIGNDIYKKFVLFYDFISYQVYRHGHDMLFKRNVLAAVYLNSHTLPNGRAIWLWLVRTVLITLLTELHLDTLKQTLRLCLSYSMKRYRWQTQRQSSDPLR